MQSYWMLSLGGMAAAIWTLFGVVIVSRMLPSYSHRNNFLSELGAIGKPTEKIHPLINNYPAGIFLTLFGIYLSIDQKSSHALHIVGALILVHGFCHFVTGYFPCEADREIAKSSPSQSHKIHCLGAFVMQLTLVSAGVYLFFFGANISVWLRWYSLLCATVSTVFFVLVFMKNAPIGLYQRISFGSLLLWVATLSWLSYASL